MRVAAIEAVCARHRVPLKAAALQFPLHHPCVATVIPGMRSPAEIAENLAMLRAPIPAELWRELKTAGLIDGVGADAVRVGDRILISRCQLHSAARGGSWIGGMRHAADCTCLSNRSMDQRIGPITDHHT